MKTSLDSVNRPTTTKTVSYWASNKTDAILVASLTNEFGDPLDCVYPETLTFTCTSDQSTGSALYSENFVISGPPSVAFYAYNWPQGSGANGSIQLKDAVLPNLISNGGFKTFTVPNVPDSWTISSGVAGTDVVQTATAKRGTSAVQFTSTGSNTPALKQQLSSSLVKPNQVIIFNSWMKISTLDAAGVVTVKLTDGNGVVLTDDAGNNLSATFGTNGGAGVAATFTNISTAFATPRQLPSSGVYLSIQLSTSTTAGHNLIIDLVGLNVGQQLYAQGPYVQMFSTANASAVNDYAQLVITNNASNTGWVRFGQRVLGLPSLGAKFYWPSSVSPTISDGLL